MHETILEKCHVQCLSGPILRMNTHGPLKRTKFNYELRSADLNWVVKMSIEQECIESRYDRKIWTDQSRVDSDSKGIESDVSLGSDLQEMEIYKEV